MPAKKLPRDENGNIIRVPKPAAVQSGDPYSLSVKILGRIYKSTGETLKDAINALDLKIRVRSLSVWHIEHNGKVEDKIIYPAIAFKVLNTEGMAREIALTNFLKMFSI